MLYQKVRPKTRFLLLLDSCGFVDMGHALWWEDRSVVYNCCWSSTTQLFTGLSPTDVTIIFYCLWFETPPTWRAFISPRNRAAQWYPRRRDCLLQLAGLRWRYSNRLHTNKTFPLITSLYRLLDQSQSHFTADSQPASSPLRGRLTRYCFLEFVVLSLWGTLSDERPNTVQQFILCYMCMLPSNAGSLF
jgi:hypothetical protein